ncbi:unnamed protein product [Peronospora effusa]|nr:unnamed protein product [Peronospora effusa]
MEMLESIICIVSQRNIEQVLLEFKEYATEVDVEFVHRSVRAIGRCAVKLERAAEKCINVLLALIQTKVNYILLEAIVVIKDIFRKYPNHYESIIATLCENLDTLDESEAKASMIWIIGEYAERIDNADELLESFMDSCDDETAQRPNETQEMFQKVFHKATENSDSLELRDRGDDICAHEPSVLDELIGKISTLASVYHKLPSAFVVRSTVPEVHGHRQDGDYSVDGEGEGEGFFDQTEDGRIGQQAGDLVDLLDMSNLTLGDPSSSIALDPVAATSASASLVDIFSGPAAPPAPVAVSGGAVQKKLLMDAQQGKGLVMTGAFTRRSSSFVLDVDLENQSFAPIMGVSIQFSTFGMAVQYVWYGGNVGSNDVFITSGTGTTRKPGCAHECEPAVCRRRCGTEPQFAGCDLERLVRRRGILPVRMRSFGWFYRDRQHGVDRVCQHVVEYRRSERALLYTMTNIVALFELTFDDTGTTKVCLKLEQKAFSTQMQQMMERLLA